MRKKLVFQVIIGQAEAGYYVAECPALEACYTQGKTYEEAIAVRVEERRHSDA